VFEGGFNVPGKLNLCGFDANARVSVNIRNAPWSTAEYLCVGYTGNFDLDTTIESQGSCPQIFVRQRATLNFGVSDANTNSAARLDLAGVTSYPAGGTVNLNDTTQSFCRVYGSLGKITGGYPSCIVINDPEGYTTNLSAKVEGGAGFLKRGAGTFTLTGRDFASGGDIAVESGVLEIASDATWRNGTNVFVSGSGTLKLGGANRFNGSFVQFNLGEDGDGWMIDIPSGCAQTVDYAWDADGNRLPCGVYGASGVQGVNRNRYASHFPANGGVLRVKAHGTVVSLR
jgi:autotransporter-associated beta strand protein